MKSAIIWGILFVLNFLCFFFWISPEVYKLGSIFIPMIGGVLSCIFLIQAIKFLKEDLDTEKKVKRYNNLAAACFILSAGLGFLFTYHNTARLKSELAENGIKTHGIVTGGFSQDRGKYGMVYSVSVTYLSEQGDSIQARQDVGQEMFGHLWKGKEVELIYSAKRPKNIEILAD